MSLTADDTEIAMMMPHRAGIPLVEYLSLMFLVGAEDLLCPKPEHLGIRSGQSAVVYSPETEGDGEICHFQKWDMDALVMEPTSSYIEGNIIIRRKQETGLFSPASTISVPSGASFYTDQADFVKNGLFLVEFEIHGCGTCETTVTTARIASLSHSLYGYLVGIHFELTERQRKKAQQLLLCLKAEHVQPLSDSSRHRWTPSQRTS